MHHLVLFSFQFKDFFLLITRENNVFISPTVTAGLAGLPGFTVLFSLSQETLAAARGTWKGQP